MNFHLLMRTGSPGLPFVVQEPSVRHHSLTRIGRAVGGLEVRLQLELEPMSPSTRLTIAMLCRKTPPGYIWQPENSES